MSRFKHVVYWYIDANQQLRPANESRVVIRGAV